MKTVFFMILLMIFINSSIFATDYEFYIDVNSGNDLITTSGTKSDPYRSIKYVIDNKLTEIKDKNNNVYLKLIQGVYTLYDSNNNLANQVRIDNTAFGNLFIEGVGRVIIDGENKQGTFVLLTKGGNTFSLKNVIIKRFQLPGNSAMVIKTYGTTKNVIIERVELSNNTPYNNSIASVGIVNIASAQKLSFKNVLINKNKGNYVLAAACGFADFSNVTIVNNECYTYGILINNSPIGRFKDSIIANNTIFKSDGFLIHANGTNFENNNFYNNSEKTIRYQTVVPIIDYATLSDFLASPYNKENFSVDPEFADLANDNFRLKTGSKCLYKGAPNGKYFNYVGAFAENIPTDNNQSTPFSWNEGWMVNGTLTVADAVTNNLIELVDNKIKLKSNSPVTLEFQTTFATKKLYDFEYISHEYENLISGSKQVIDINKDKLRTIEVSILNPNTLSWETIPIEDTVNRYVVGLEAKGIKFKITLRSDAN